MLRSMTKWAVFSYSLLMIILGWVGYYQKASKMSLIMGCCFGGLLLLSTLVMSMGKKAGSYSALALTLILTGVFAYRYSVTGAHMPALLAVISCAMLIFLLVQLGRWKK